MAVVEVNAGSAVAMLVSVERKQITRSAMMRAVSAAAKLVRDNFRALNKTRNKYKSNFYTKEGANVTTAEVSADGKSGSVVVASVKMAHKYFGGVIRAKNAKYLAVPVSDWAHRLSARGDGDLRRNPAIQFRRGKTSAGLLFRVSGKGKNRKEELAFVLKRSVTQRAFPEVLPEEAALSRTVSEALGIFAGVI